MWNYEGGFVNKQSTLDKYLDKKTVDFYNEFALVVERNKKIKDKLREAKLSLRV